MLNRLILGCLAAVVFLVTVGIPIFQHDCTETNSHYTQWFTFSSEHCQDESLPRCCKFEKTDCCSITSSVIALKSDQEHGAFLPKLSLPVSNPFRASSSFITPFFSKENKKVEDRYFPPPNVRFGIFLLKFIQVFRL